MISVPVESPPVLTAHAEKLPVCAKLHDVQRITHALKLNDLYMIYTELMNLQNQGIALKTLGL